MSFTRERYHLFETLNSPEISGSKVSQVIDKNATNVDIRNIGYKGYKFRVELPIDADYTTPVESTALFTRRVVEGAYKGLPINLLDNFITDLIRYSIMALRDNTSKLVVDGLAEFQEGLLRARSDIIKEQSSRVLEAPNTPRQEGTLI